MSGSPDPKAGKREKAPRKPLPRRPKPPATKEEQEGRLRFKTLVIACDGGCIVHGDSGDCEGVLQAHHVVTQQQLRQHGFAALLWDPNNGATVCEKAHERHTKALERIPRDRLPARCLRFAAQHGFESVLDRYYAPAR